MNRSTSVTFTVLGLALGLIGTLAGIQASSAIQSSPMLLGCVTAVWFAVSAGIVGGRLRSESFGR
jgi:hypothetical protein